MNKKTKIEIHVPVKNNRLLQKALDKINKNEQIYTLWRVVNVNAVDRLGMTDHGPVHVQIVANIALKLARMLQDAQIEMSLTRDYGLGKNHAELVIVLASLLHDLGMSISRAGHEEFSLFIANKFLYEILDFLPIEERTIVASEVLHAIISHRSDGHPLTIEAGIVRIADALDMSKGRSRITYESGKSDIYSISATAIDEIKIEKGKEKIIQINIIMNNSAGVFQVDQLLKNKIKNSGIEKFISVRAIISQETESKILNEYVL
jgi:uncharacterized protein